MSSVNLMVRDSSAYIRKQADKTSDTIGVMIKNSLLTIKSTTDYNGYYKIDSPKEYKNGYILITSTTPIRGTDNVTKEDAENIKTGNYEYDTVMNNLLNYSNESTSGVTMTDLLSNNFSGVYGMPYQFMKSVDRRLSGTKFGRKYTEKIVGRMPLLFLTPGKQSFMADFSTDEKKAVLSTLTDIGFGEGGSSGLDSILSRDGKYYTFEFAYKEYFQYVNPMCNTVAKLLGIGSKKIDVGGYKNRLDIFDWSRAINSDFKSYFSGKENVMFYINSINSISESWSNDTRESSLVNTVNGLSDTAKEIQFIAGNALGTQVDALSNENYESTLSSINSVIDNYLSGSNVLKGLSGNMTTVLSGGKLVFPELWSDSDCSRSYDIDLKLRSPDCDSVSVYMNIIVPFIHLLAMTAPRQMSGNGYSAPFLVRAFYKGCFNVDMGIITSLSVSKGKEMSWNDDGLPTEMDISISIKDLYTSMFISNNKDIGQMMNNTCLMDYLSNMAGLNIAKPELTRQLEVYFMLTAGNVTQYPNKIWNEAAQEISNLLSKLY